MGKRRRLKVRGGGLVTRLKNAAQKAAQTVKKVVSKGKNSSSSPPAAGTSGEPTSSGSSVAAGSSVDAAIKRQGDLAAKALQEIALAKESTFNKILEKIGTFLRGLIQLLFKRDSPIAHYVAIAIVLIVLIVGIGFSINKSTKKRKSKKKTLWDRIFGYRFNNIFQQFSGIKPVTDPRPTILGRCDNVEFIEKRVGKNGGVCVSNKLPKPLEWIIEPDKIPELKELPQSIIDKISNNRQKFTVTIPWKAEGLVFVPDCDKAMFADGTPAYLLDEGLGFCRKFSVPKTIYMGKFRYPSGHSKYTGLDNLKKTKIDNEIGTVSAGEVCSIQAAKDLGIFNNTTFYKVGYDSLKSYNPEFDNKALTHSLCSENTLTKKASVLCPLHKNAGIGFTANRMNNTCIAAECPTGFTEDKKDPMNCIKPTKAKVVQIRSRNDEQYDDWYTIPNYHLGNKYSSSNNVHYAPCPSGSLPYYNSDPVDDSMAEENSIDQIGVCIDKDLFMGGKYSDTADYCPISLIKRVGSTRNELMEDYRDISGRDDVPESAKQKINKIVEGIKSDYFTNLSLMSEEMEMACNKLHLPDKDGNYPKLKAAYVICDQLAKNEDGFAAKFAGEPKSLIKLRQDAAKYSCQQLFGVPIDKRSDPNAFNENADNIGEATLNFPDVDQIQFEQYIQEYDNEVREKEKTLPIISADKEKKTFVNMFKSKTWAAAIWIAVIILIGYAIYYNRDYIGNFINCYVSNNLIWFINLFKTVTILPRECLSAEEMQKRRTEKLKTKIEAEETKQKEAEIDKKDNPEATAPAADNPAGPVADNKPVEAPAADNPAGPVADNKPVEAPAATAPAATAPAKPEPELPEKKKGGALQ